MFCEIIDRFATDLKYFRYIFSIALLFVIAVTFIQSISLDEEYSSKTELSKKTAPEQPDENEEDTDEEDGANNLLNKCFSFNLTACTIHSEPNSSKNSNCLSVYINISTPPPKL